MNAWKSDKKMLFSKRDAYMPPIYAGHSAM